MTIKPLVEYNLIRFSTYRSYSYKYPLIKLPHEDNGEWSKDNEDYFVIALMIIH